MSTFPLMFPEPPRSPRMLVVDDEAAMRGLWVRVLERLGYHVDAVNNGSAALAQLAAAHYDVVLTDLNMPQLDGLGLLRVINRQYTDTSVILITAYASLDTARQALRLGAFDYLTKPLDLTELERTVQRCLEARELQRLRHERQALAEVVALLDVSRAIGATPELQPRVDAFVHQIWTRFRPNTVTLSLLGPHERTLRLLGQRGISPPLQCDDVVLPPAPTAVVLEDAHRRMTKDLPCDAQVQHVLHVQDRPVGVLQLTWQDHTFLPDEHARRALDILAASMAEVLENGRLYDRLQQQSVQTITALAAAIDARDPYTRGHSEQVTRYAVRLAQTLGKPSAWVERVRYASLLHDVGKIGVPDAVLLKPSRLTNAEFEIMKQHCEIGAMIVAPVFPDLAPIVRYHHENWQGTGYPTRLAGDAIPLEARMLAVADAFDAMTSDRAYRAALPVQQALARLRAGRNIQWQGALVDAFAALIEQEGAALLASKARAAQTMVYEARAQYHTDQAASLHLYPDEM
jgi:response regulator RpfG family c-di-GMP phosphodiesterase